MTDRVRIVEVAPRDGLQNEPVLVPTPAKIALVDLLSACGFDMIEAASFVSRTRVPQMADAEAVMAGIARAPGVAYAALAPNLAGYARARAARADVVAVFVSASEGFSRANLGCGVDESFVRLAPVVEAAAADGARLRGYVSCVIACPFDGPTQPSAAARAAERLAGFGCAEISLGDTIGAGDPVSVGRLLDAVLAALPTQRLAGHFHDTGGRALAMVEAALERGLRVFDAAAGGLGGCPFAPGAPGNLDTLALVDRLAALGLDSGIDRARLIEAAAFARSLRSGGGA